jgi:hypothetical protein
MLEKSGIGTEGSEIMSRKIMSKKITINKIVI